MRIHLFMVSSLLCYLLACGGDNPGGNGGGGSAGTGGQPGSNGGGSSAGTGGQPSDNYPTVGCSTLKEGKTACTTTHGPLTQQQVDSVSHTCADGGGTVLHDETCARPPGNGCCISGVAGTRVTTCHSGPNVDPAQSQSSCLASGGYWSTQIGDNPPTTGGGGGADGAGGGTSSAFKNACYQAAIYKCTAYTITNPQLESACTQGGGVISTTCPSSELLGCCIKGGYVATCFYTGADGDVAALKKSCTDGGDTFSAFPP